jgi:hypothetical protein
MCLTESFYFDNHYPRRKHNQLCYNPYAFRDKFVLNSINLISYFLTYFQLKPHHISHVFVLLQNLSSQKSRAKTKLNFSNIFYTVSDPWIKLENHRNKTTTHRIIFCWWNDIISSLNIQILYIELINKNEKKRAIFKWQKAVTSNILIWSSKLNTNFVSNIFTSFELLFKI